MPFLDELFRATLIKVGSVVQPKRAHLKLGSGVTYVDDAKNDQGILTATGGGGGSAPNVATFAALLALTTVGATPDASDGQTRYVTGDPVGWVYDAESGAGFVTDSNTIGRPNDVATPSPGAWYRATSAPVLTTIAALRLATSGKHTSIHVQAFATKGDGGGGIFDDVTGVLSTADDGGVFLHAGARVFKRRYAGSVSANWFGAVGDGATDARTAIVAAIASLPAGGHVEFLPGTYLWAGAPIAVPSNVTLVGTGKNGAVTLKYTGTGAAAITCTDTDHAGLKNLKLWATQTDALRIACTASHLNQYTTCATIQFVTESATAAAVYCIGNTGTSGAGYIYWPIFNNCTWIGPNTAKSAAIRTAKTGNGTLFLTVRGGTMEVFGRHLELNLCSNARVDFVTFAGCVVTLPITVVDATANTLTSPAHPFVTDDVVQVASTLTLPAGLLAATDYYVTSPTTDTVQLSATPGGSAIDFTTVGSGVITFSKIGRYVYMGTASTCVINLPHSELAGSADKIVEFAAGSAQCAFIDGSAPEYANIVGAKAPHVAGSSNSVGGFTQTSGVDSNISNYPATFPLLLQDSILEKTAGHGTVLGCATLKSTEAAFSQNVKLTGGAKLYVATIQRPDDGGSAVVIGNGVVSFSSVVRGTPVSGNGTATWDETGDTRTTTDATSTLLLDMPFPYAIATYKSSMVVTFEISGICSATNDCATFTRRATFKNVAGTITLIGSADTIGTDQKTDATWGDPTVSAGTLGGKVSIVGKAATTIAWAVRAKSTVSTFF